MTNDRRKTFNTPLEFWQWAIMEPGKRKASSGHGHLVHVWASSNLYFEIWCKWVGKPHPESGALKLEHFPLTAVEDEHGVIEEEKLDLEAISASGVLRDTMMSILGLTKSQANDITWMIRGAVHEEIAAAVIERQEMVDFPFHRLSNYRLKPKGE